MPDKLAAKLGAKVLVVRVFSDYQFQAPDGSICEVIAPNRTSKERIANHVVMNSAMNEARLEFTVVDYRYLSN